MDTRQIHSVHTYQYQSGLISEDDVHYRDAAQLEAYRASLLSSVLDIPVIHTNDTMPLNIHLGTFSDYE